MKISLILARDYHSHESVLAAIHAVSYALQLNRVSDAETAYRRIDQLLQLPAWLTELSTELRVRLHLTQLEHHFRLDSGAERSRWGWPSASDRDRRRMVMQARQWLRLGDPAAEAMELASWAREQGLGLIELQALHIAAIESRPSAQDMLERARVLAQGIDPLIAEVIVRHIEKIATGASATDVSIPEVRLLAELGLWLPLPASLALSAREREISLLASLGYQSRFIAERLHLSTRMVETHLAHVYMKLGVADRAGLRDWFSADRRFA